jgi:hypothetical protein
MENRPAKKITQKQTAVVNKNVNRNSPVRHLRVTALK